MRALKIIILWIALSSANVWADIAGGKAEQKARNFLQQSNLKMTLPKWFDLDSAAECATMATAAMVYQIKGTLKLDEVGEGYYAMLLVSTGYLSEYYISHGLPPENWRTLVKIYTNQITTSGVSSGMRQNCDRRLNGAVTEAVKK